MLLLTTGFGLLPDFSSFSHPAFFIVKGFFKIVNQPYLPIAVCMAVFYIIPKYKFL